jgi:NOL1/NOP2/fmu family ribosome biogenesis protein
MIQDQILNHGAVSLKSAIGSGIKAEPMEKKGYNYEYGGDAAAMEELKRERVELQEEVRRLFTLLKDNKKYDIYVLQKENERLIKMVGP